jgi:hydrogenase-4 membrane subunit HyfE
MGMLLQGSFIVIERERSFVFHYVFYTKLENGMLSTFNLLTMLKINIINLNEIIF